MQAGQAVYAADAAAQQALQSAAKAETDARAVVVAEKVASRRSGQGGAHLARAALYRASLEGAFLVEAHLEGTSLLEQICKRLDRRATPDVASDKADSLPASPTFLRFALEAHLEGANLSRAYFDSGTALDGVTLGNRTLGFVALADVHWGGVNLTVVQCSPLGERRWRARSKCMELGDECVVRQPRDADGKRKDKRPRLGEFDATARANRQFATVRREQGLNDDADRFAYRAQVFQRTVLRRRRRRRRWLVTTLLAALAGYDYWLERIAIADALVLAAFTAACATVGIPNASHAT
jgi:hypothetical protein